MTGRRSVINGACPVRSITETMITNYRSKHRCACHIPHKTNTFLFYLTSNEWRWLKRVQATKFHPGYLPRKNIYRVPLYSKNQHGHVSWKEEEHPQGAERRTASVAQRRLSNRSRFEYSTSGERCNAYRASGRSGELEWTQDASVPNCPSNGRNRGGTSRSTGELAISRTARNKALWSLRLGAWKDSALCNKKKIQHH